MMGLGSVSSSLLLLGQAAQVQQVPAASLSVQGMAPAWAFWILSILTVVGALSTILRRNLIGAVMSMVATFFGIASLYALLSAHFLAAIQVLVYAGAIMVLFVFVIMVLNREEAEPWALRSPVIKALGTGSLVYLAVRLGEMLLSPKAGVLQTAGYPSGEYGTVASIGDYFFTKFLFPFEAISILLVIAVIGAVVLARTVAKPTSVHEAGAAPLPSSNGDGDDAAADASHGGH